jgi:[ribosomal protein S5]-alanine N-acetyltransferase
MLDVEPFRPPLITTSRLALRGYELSDAPAIFAYSSDVETTRFMSWETARSLADTLVFLNDVVAQSYRKGGLDYAVTRNGESVAVGGLGLYWRPQEHQVMELGYILRRDLWGQGLMVEAARALMHHAFASSEVEHIFAPILAPNAKSRRAAEKMGMKLDGVLRSRALYNGQRWDLAIYSVLRGELT